MAFQQEKQSVLASQLLRAIADGEDIHLNRCTVTGHLDVNRLFDTEEGFGTEKLKVSENDDRKTLILSQSLVFDNCIFEENVVFSGPWSQPDSVVVRFEKDCVFNNSRFAGQSRFRGAVFCESASFDGCSFEGIVTFKNSVIRGDAKFRTVVFNGYCLFGDAEFASSARFTNTHFAKGANFSGTKFSGSIDFSGVYSSSRAVPAYESVSFARRRYGEDEGFWRFVKQSAQEAGYYQLAGQCFYNERCASLRSKFHRPASENLSIFGKVQRVVYMLRLLPELLLGKWLFGYGERPVRVLGVSAVIIVLCAFFYAQPGWIIHRTGDVDSFFWHGLYFSTITFTTLGYGDLYPATEGFCRLVAMTEAMSGAILMALFVVCLAKKFSRG